jgi:hypothetical protein
VVILAIAGQVVYLATLVFLVLAAIQAHPGLAVFPVTAVTLVFRALVAIAV